MMNAVYFVLRMVNEFICFVYHLDPPFFIQFFIELKREIEVWKRACNSIVGYSRDENSVRSMLNHKVETLETILRQHCYETVPPEDNYRSVLTELEQKVSIVPKNIIGKIIMIKHIK